MHAEYANPMRLQLVAVQNAPKKDFGSAKLHGDEKSEQMFSGNREGDWSSKSDSFLLQR